MGRPTIVCIDDDLDTLIGYQSLLWNHGSNVLISTSGSRGLDLVKWLPIDGVIVDFQLPDLNGGLVATEAKKLKQQLPVMMVTGQKSIPDEVLEHVDVLFSKGESPQQLLEALHSIFHSDTSKLTQHQLEVA